jgi:hypothetical protein
MKKAIALSFLLFAVILVLAHSVVPHHYHHNIFAVCFQTFHCTDSEEMHERFHDYHRHGDGCSTMEECQLLKEMYLRLDNNKIQIDLNLDNDIQNIVLLLFSVNPIAEINGLEGLPFRQKSCLLLFYTDFIAQSIGLRAPPVC